MAEGWAEPALGDGDHDQGDEKTKPGGLQYRRISRSRWAGVLLVALCGMGWPPTAASCCVPGLGGSGPGWWWSRWPATPELNPVEPLWASLKGTGLANLAGDTLEEIIAAVERGIQRIRATLHLPFSFLRRCGLSLW